MKNSSKAAAKRRLRMDSPVGPLVIESNGRAVCAIYNASAEDGGTPVDAPEDAILTQAAKEMAEYFAGKRRNFTFPMEPEGTPFQKSVWDALLKIPYGQTASYGQIAMQVNNPKGARAVGMACNRNPIWIAVPCHRVVGAGGALVGYALGTGMKQKLLDMEQSNA